ncbi:MAG: TIM barrel protein [Armatimonadota bacterium]|nr:TIM barrel protein [Armatimonadota bacterium]
MPIRQSISWWCFAGRGVSDEELLKQTKAIGYEAVELVKENLLDQVRDAGLKIASHSGHRGIDSGLNDPAQHDRIEAEIHKNLALAQKYQIPNLIVFSGSRRSGLSEEEGIANTAQGLSRIARAAEEAGVNLVIELLNSKVDHKGYQCDHTEWGVEVCRRVGSPRVGLLYDIYHMQIMEGDVIRTIGEHHAHFHHYHTAGNPGRHDMDDTQELNYPPIMKAIAATGYEGYVGHEFIPKADPIAALQAAYDLCRV